MYMIASLHPLQNPLAQQQLPALHNRLFTHMPGICNYVNDFLRWSFPSCQAHAQRKFLASAQSKLALPEGSMHEVHLLSNMFHQSRDFLAERAVPGGAFIESESYFLGIAIIGKVCGEAFTKLVHQVVGAEGGVSDIFQVIVVAAPVDTYTIK